MKGNGDGRLDATLVDLAEDILCRAYGYIASGFSPDPDKTPSASHLAEVASTCEALADEVLSLALTAKRLRRIRNGDEG